ncbi:MAG: hypothetical protein ACRDU8_02355, partial [Egibacteraceae bacterium]
PAPTAVAAGLWDRVVARAAALKVEDWQRPTLCDEWRSTTCSPPVGRRRPSSTASTSPRHRTAGRRGGDLTPGISPPGISPPGISPPGRLDRAGRRREGIVVA